MHGCRRGFAHGLFTRFAGFARFTRFTTFARFAAFAWRTAFARFTQLAWFTRFAGLTHFTRLASFARFTHFAGLAGFTRFARLVAFCIRRVGYDAVAAFAFVVFVIEVGIDRTIGLIGTTFVTTAAATTAASAAAASTFATAVVGGNAWSDVAVLDGFAGRGGDGGFSEELGGFLGLCVERARRWRCARIGTAFGCRTRFRGLGSVYARLDRLGLAAGFALALRIRIGAVFLRCAFLRRALFLALLLVRSFALGLLALGCGLALFLVRTRLLVLALRLAGLVLRLALGFAAGGLGIARRIAATATLFATAAALVTATTAAALVAIAAARGQRTLRWLDGGGGNGFAARCRRFAREQGQHAREEALLRRRARAGDQRRRGGGRRGDFVAFRTQRRGAGRYDAADRRAFRFFAGLGDLRRRRDHDRGQAVVARPRRVADIGALDALDFQVRRFQLFVGDDDHRDVMALFDLADLAALFVEQEVGHVRRRLHQHLAGVVLHRVFLDQAQGRQGQRFDAADAAVAGAARADDLGRFAQAGTQALARHFHQAEARDAAELHAGAVELERVLQRFLDFALVARAVHVDEVDHDQAAGIADAQLARDLDGRFAVGVERGLLDVAALGRLGRVDVDGRQCFGLVDHDGAARRQAHGAFERILDLGFDLEAREQRRGVLVQLELAQVVRHDLLDEIARVLEQVFVIDEDLADVIAQVVAQRADDELGFLVDQERTGARGGGFGDRLPQLQQVVQVPLQFFRVAAHAGRADDQAHVVGAVEVVHDLLEVGPVLALDAARDAAGTRVVRHQHHVAAGQGDERGQGCALVAAFFLLDLDDDFLAFLDQLADAGAVVIDARGEVFAGHFLQGEEAVALAAVFDEAGFQRGLDPGDAALVDVGLLLFLGRNFDIEVEQVLAVHDGHTQLFTLSRVDQHAFHCSDSVMRSTANGAEGAYLAGLPCATQPEAAYGKTGKPGRRTTVAHCAGPAPSWLRTLATIVGSAVLFWSAATCVAPVRHLLPCTTADPPRRLPRCGQSPT